MKKRMIIMIIILLVIFGGTFGFDLIRAYFVKQYFATYQEPPITVSTAKVTKQLWQPTLTAVGSIAAINGVDVNPEVSGQVIKIFFKSGQMVKERQPLIQLDDAIDKEKLKDDTAQLVLAELDFNRQKQLYKTRSTSKSELDKAQAKFIQAQAAVESSKVMIEKKLIRAPFAGKIGIRKVNLGQYVQPGNDLVSLQSLDPLFVNFTLPEQDVRLVHVGQELKINVTAYPQETFTGKISAINAEVSIDTRTLEVQGIVPNKVLKLYPGVFANVTVILPDKLEVLTIPRTAVTYSLYGDTVYVVEQKGKDKKGNPILVANQHFVRLGANRNNRVIVKQGLKEGDVVVATGQLKLHKGARITVNNNIKLPVRAIGDK